MKQFRFLLVLAILLCTHTVVQSQDIDSTSIYQSQYTQLNKAYAQNPHDVANLMDMARFYAHDRNPMRSLPLAMQYVCSAETNFAELIADKDKYREASKLIRKKIDITAIRNLKRAITEKAQEELSTGRTYSLVEIDAFEKAFENNPTISRIVKSMRMEQSLNVARSGQDPDNLYAVITNYPGTSEAEQADMALAQWLSNSINSKTSEREVETIAEQYSKSNATQKVAMQRKAQLFFEKARKENSVNAYREYIQKYPSGDDYLNALEYLDALLDAKYASLQSPEEIIAFIDSNETNPLAEQALERLRNSILQEHNMKAARLFLQHFPLDIKYNDIYKSYYEWHSFEGNRQPIESFAQHHSDYPFPMAVQSDMSQAARIDAFNLNKPYNPKDQEAYASFIRLNTGKGIAFVALQRMLQPLCARKDWKNALALLEAHSLSFEVASKTDFEALKKILSTNPDPRTLRRSEMNPNFDLINPILSLDGSKLYFTQLTPSGKSIGYAQSTSEKQGGWQFAGNVQFSNISNQNIEIFSFFDNGKKMLLGQNGDVMVAEFDGVAWQVTETFPEPVNTQYLETDAFMLPDGSGLLIASDRPEGYNVQQSNAYFHGDNAPATDLYFIPRVEQGWGTPINLGNKINSAYCEKSPLMSSDLQTLYFISDGHGGMGYGDIYSVTRKNLSSWTEWNEPVNLGREANTTFNETSMSFSPDESRIFFATNSLNGHYTCYSIGAQTSGGNSYRNVHIDCSECTPSSITIMDEKESTPLLSIVNPDPQSGIDFSCIKDHNCIVFTSYPNTYIPPISVKGTQLKLTQCNNWKSSFHDSLYYAMPTLAFTDSSDNLTPLAKATLDNLSSYLEQANTSRIVFSVNYNGDDDATSFRISQQQGKAIKKYLTNKGFDGNRISIATYGNLHYRKGMAPTTPISIHFDF